MSKKVIVSIACHEQPLVIQDQLQNIRKFVPNSQVVLHSSLDSGSNFKNQLLNLSNNEFKDFMFVNNVSIPTHAPDEAGNVKNLTTVHAENFKYISSLINDFDIFTVNTSNDMFVRKGINKLFEEFKCCITSHNEPVDIFYNNCHTNSKVPIDLLKKHIDVKFAISCATEGTYYPKECWATATDIILNKIGGYLKCEEVIVHTLILNLFPELLKSNVGTTYVFHNGQHYETKDEDILDVRNGKYPEKYAVKRVPRTMNNHCRNFINELTKND